MPENSTWNSPSAHPTPDIEEYFSFLHRFAIGHTAVLGLVILVPNIPGDAAEAGYGTIISSREACEIASAKGYFGVGVAWNKRAGYIESKN